MKLISQPKLGWTEHLRLRRLLGTGGQGVVYLSERRGSDNFTLPVALKFFSPERFPDERSYREAMERMAQISQPRRPDSARQSARRAEFHRAPPRPHPGDGMDRRLRPRHAARARTCSNGPATKVSQSRWEYINRVVATRTEVRTRFKPGVAVSIIRECLAGLAALHREEIVHGDIKPSNIMVKRTGNAKIIDIGSAIDLNDMPQMKTCTPQYAAPEMLDREEITPRSDLCSVGYVLVELLAGAPLFAGIKEYGKLLEAKRTLPQRLHKMLPTRNHAQRAVDDDLPPADGARSDAAVRQRRAGRHRPRRPGRVPAHAGARRSGERVRERAAVLAGGAGLTPNKTAVAQAGIDGGAVGAALYRDTNGEFPPLAWLQLGGWSCLSTLS